MFSAQNDVFLFEKCQFEAELLPLVAAVSKQKS